MMGVLEGRVAIITGAGRGLGRSYALRFAQEGAKVVVNSVTPGPDGSSATSSAHAVVDEIVAAGGEAVAHIGSASSWAEGERMVQLALDTFGSLDVLVTNAGFIHDRSLVNMSEDEWDSVVDVHLKGSFVPLRFAAAHWRERTKAGEQVNAAVVNTTAGAGLHGNIGQANYGSAKAGVAALTVIAARELQRFGVRVNAVSPLARTRMLETVPGLAEAIRKPEDPEEFDAFDPDNVAPLVTYLASDRCALTGQLFNVHGGKLGLYSGWSVERRFERSVRWTVDELAEALRDVPPGPPPFDPS